MAEGMTVIVAKKDYGRFDENASDVYYFHLTKEQYFSDEMLFRDILSATTVIKCFNFKIKTEGKYNFYNRKNPKLGQEEPFCRIPFRIIKNDVGVFYDSANDEFDFSPRGGEINSSTKEIDICVYASFIKVIKEDGSEIAETEVFLKDIILEKEGISDSIIKENFCLEQDMRVIEKWAGKCCENNKRVIGITLREAGKNSLKRLREGCGAKPHKILDKSIRKIEDLKSLESVGSFLKDHADGRDFIDKLLGLVAVWSEKKIKGLYLTVIGSIEFYGEAVYFSGAYDICYPYIDISEKKGLELLYNKYNAFSECRDYYFSRCFFTGDYDIHDLIASDDFLVKKDDEKEELKTLEKYLQRLGDDLVEDRYRQLALYYDKEEDFFRKEESYSGMDKRYGMKKPIESIEKVIASIKHLTDQTGQSKEHTEYSLLDRTFAWILDEMERQNFYHSSEKVNDYSLDKIVSMDYRRYQHGPQAQYMKKMLFENEETSELGSFQFTEAYRKMREEGFEKDSDEKIYYLWANKLVEKVCMRDTYLGCYSTNSHWHVVRELSEFEQWAGSVKSGYKIKTIDEKQKEIFSYIFSLINTVHNTLKKRSDTVSYLQVMQSLKEYYTKNFDKEMADKVMYVIDFLTSASADEEME